MDKKKEMMICPRWQVCETKHCTKSHSPHRRDASCELSYHSCPACVPFKPDIMTEDLLLGASNG